MSQFNHRKFGRFCLTLSGGRGDIDDSLLESKTPTMFVIGQFANTCNIDDLEDMRERMRAENSLVVIGGKTTRQCWKM